MVEQGSGSIVCLSSFAAQAFISLSPMEWAHAATDRMAEDMATDLGGTGVTVVALYFGTVRTLRTC